MTNYHTSVLLHETIDLVDVTQGKRYIDATLGGGGHTNEILQRGGKVLSLDVDQDALDHVDKKRRAENGERRTKDNLTLARGNFKNIDKLAAENGFKKVAGVVFDLGISSHHVDEGSRGFSLQKEAPLDMRMDKTLGVTAADLVNVLTKGELLELFSTYGEEPNAYAIARRIVNVRKVKRIETTTELADIVKSASHWSGSKIHPATRVFQALRIIVNDELGVLKEALPKALQLLDSGGRIVVISFHSLEDRIVKQTFREWERTGKGIILTKKPIVPSLEEIQNNSRSRSAKLRGFEKI